MKSELLAKGQAVTQSPRSPRIWARTLNHNQSKENPGTQEHMCYVCLLSGVLPKRDPNHWNHQCPDTLHPAPSPFNLACDPPLNTPPPFFSPHHPILLSCCSIDWLDKWMLHNWGCHSNCWCHILPFLAHTHINTQLQTHTRTRHQHTHAKKKGRKAMCLWLCCELFFEKIKWYSPLLWSIFIQQLPYILPHSHYRRPGGGWGRWGLRLHGLCPYIFYTGWIGPHH